jgi:hypothetical protein
VEGGLNHEQRTIRAYAQDRLNIDIKSSTDLWDVADYETAMEYNRGGSQANGPTSENFVMDWECRGLTQWLKDCTTIFGHDFLAQHQAGVFPLIKGIAIDIHAVKSSFRDYVLYLKRYYNAADQTLQRNQSTKQARSWSRRQQVMFLGVWPTDR